MFVWKEKCPWENVITRTQSWIDQPAGKNGPTDGFMDKAVAEWSSFGSNVSGLKTELENRHRLK